jgi:hypothetical protein
METVTIKAEPKSAVFNGFPLRPAFLAAHMFMKEAVAAK